MLDRLTGQQVAAVVRSLLQDPPTAKKIFIAVPRALVAGMGLPEAVITDERTVALRHADNKLPALLLANTDDDQGASLQDVTLIGAKQLSEEPKLWIQAASAGCRIKPGGEIVFLIPHDFEHEIERRQPGAGNLLDAQPLPYSECPSFVSPVRVLSNQR